MKLVLFKDNLSTGRGADKLYCSLAEEFSLMGWEVTLITYPSESPFTFKLGPHVKLEYVAVERVREYVKSFDLCLAAGPNEILHLTQWGRVKPPVKTVTTMLLAPEGFFKWRHFYRNWCIKRAFNLSDGLIVLCNEYITGVRKFASMPKIQAIMQWPDIVLPQGPLHQKNVIVYPAAVNRRKNQMLLIDAFARIAKDFPQWQVHFYGNSECDYGTRCKRRIRMCGLESQIKFMPFTKDMGVVYEHAMIMGFPSYLEGFPLTVIEGYRYGLPAIMVDALPGSSEMVTEGVTGYITANTPEAYAEGLRRLMSNPTLLKRMKQEAQSTCEEKFSKEKILQHWVKFLEQVARGNTRD